MRRYGKKKLKRGRQKSEIE